MNKEGKEGRSHRKKKEEKSEKEYPELQTPAQSPTTPEPEKDSAAGAEEMYAT